MGHSALTPALSPGERGLEAENLHRKMKKWVRARGGSVNRSIESGPRAALGSERRFGRGASFGHKSGQNSARPERMSDEKDRSRSISGGAGISNCGSEISDCRSGSHPGAARESRAGEQVIVERKCGCACGLSRIVYCSTVYCSTLSRSAAPPGTLPGGEGVLRVTTRGAGRDTITRFGPALLRLRNP
jgi:hypothetical protein